MPRCQCKNSQENICALEPSSLTAGGPNTWNIAGAQDTDLKIVFMNTTEIPKEEMNKALKEIYGRQAWWRMPLIPALGRQRQSDLLSLRPAWFKKQVLGQPRAVTQRNRVSEKKERRKNKSLKTQANSART